MKYFLPTHLISLFLILSCNAPVKENQIRVTKLMTDYIENPAGLENTRPGFTWILSSDQRNKYQSAYQILVSSDEKNISNNFGDIWDSGKQKSDQSVQVTFNGKQLKSGHKYFWKVKVWDENDVAGAFSSPAWFEMGKMSEEDWHSSWISQAGDSAGMPLLRPAPYFRKEFDNQKTISGARLYISGLGYYKAFINGEKVGDHELDPVFTRYDRRVKYLVYDIADLLKPGRNCIGAVLGNGWYNQHTRSAWNLDSASWRDDPSLLVQLELTYKDGTKDSILSDGSWKVGNGPIIFDGIRNGEHYDARKEIKGWNTPGYDDREWKNAHVVSGPEGKMSSQIMPPIRRIRTLDPLDISEPRENVYVIDFGENITGRIQMFIEGEPGQEITLRYGERLGPDGSLDQKELARFIWTGETQTDHYICHGKGREIWESSFVYHGFQFVEIHGLTKPPGKEEYRAVVLHTDLKPAGNFSCSNEMFNIIQRNTLNSFLGNYHGYPEDCPHREKIGWSGDAQLVSATGLYNFHMVPAYIKWINDFSDEQRNDGKVPAIIPTGGWGYTFGKGPGREHGYGPHWEGAYLNIPWDMYMFTGDKGILSRYYEGFRDYMEYLERSANEYILEYGIDDHKPVVTITEGDILSTGYFFDFARKMARIAGDLGFQEDKTYYLALSEKIYNAFNDRFFDEGKGIYGNGGQTSMSMALYLGLVPEKLQDRVIENLVAEIEDKDRHIDAGVVGTRFILKTTTGYDLAGLMYEIADQRDFPGWGNWVERGATTLWQTWEGDMSLNHIMFGSIGEWFYNTLAGIRYDPGKPGFREFILKPEITDRLEWVNADFESPYGTIVSRWNRDEDGFNWQIEVPVNTTAKVYLPVTPGSEIAEGNQNLENIKSIHILNREPNTWSLELGSGKYDISVQ